MDKKKDKNLTPEELEKEDGEPLPDREAMSVISPGEHFVSLDPPPDQMWSPEDPPPGN